MYHNTPDEPKPLLVAVATAAKMLALSPVTVRRLIGGGALPAVKIGTAVRIPQ